MTLFGKTSRLLCLALAVGLALGTVTADAQQVPQSKDACKRLLADVADMRAASDSGPRANAEVDDLIQVTGHLCDQGNFVYAEKLLSIARGLLATE